MTRRRRRETPEQRRAREAATRRPRQARRVRQAERPDMPVLTLLDQMNELLEHMPPSAFCHHLRIPGAVDRLEVYWSPSDPTRVACELCAPSLALGHACAACGDRGLLHRAVQGIHYLPNIATRLCGSCLDRCPTATPPSRLPAHVVDQLAEVLEANEPHAVTCGHTAPRSRTYWRPTEPRRLRCYLCVPDAPPALWCAICHVSKPSPLRLLPLAGVTVLARVCGDCVRSTPSPARAAS